MSAHLTITKLNGLCSIQDLGRVNSQHLGFSASGASDEYSFLFANKLLNNDNNCAALEITLGQITLQASTACTIALTGADCQASINDQAIKNWQTYQLNEGDILHLNCPTHHLHSYLAISGGFSTTPWLNSQSQTYTELSLGFSGNQLKTKDKIPFDNHCINKDINQNTQKITYQQASLNSNRLIPNNFLPNKDKPLTLRFIASELFNSLTNTAQQSFINNDYQIAPQSNRMGYRLTSKATLAISHEKNLSKPVNFGAIQCPNDGQPIVLMKERQTIGGYPVMGTVIQVDLFRLSQKRSGEQVNFLPVNIEQAQAQLSAFYQKFPSNLFS